MYKRQDVPFVELVSRKITDRDFVNGRCRVHYRIVPSRLHKGRNFGRIRIRSLREDFIIEIEAEGDTTVDITGRGLDVYKRQDKVRIEESALHAHKSPGFLFSMYCTWIQPVLCRERTDPAV